MTDRISDMLIRLKNAGAVGHETVAIPFSNYMLEILNLLEKNGFVGSVEKRAKGRMIDVALLYKNGTPRIRGAKRVSKSSRRVYKGAKEIHAIKKGYGMIALSTPQGVLSGFDAKKANVGGEALFEIW